jgi:DNA-binding response OmpR family regulator
MKRVIIVDDDRDLCQMLKMRLERDGFETKVAGNGLRLISSLRVDRPDLILLDVMMSWIDGFDLCKALKQNPEFSNIPVFIMSGRTSPKDVERGYACGCTDYFTKPLDFKHLVQRIREAIGEP